MQTQKVKYIILPLYLYCIFKNLVLFVVYVYKYTPVCMENFIYIFTSAYNIGFIISIWFILEMIRGYNLYTLSV